MSQVSPSSPHISEATWIASTYSGGQGDCVEVAHNIPHIVPVRDSKRRAGDVLGFSHDAWRVFVAHLA
ncbi:DUF397 domain-containing protein [Streptomyces sp. NPDC093109]|uniref:DUF397 domain-containing protein n=1 Tax=Streptomyces sp. NPDC093109 TaxID=3154977 RepID=UPI00344BDC90